MGWFLKKPQSNRKQNKALTYITRVQRKSSLAWLKNRNFFCFLSHYIKAIKQSSRLLSEPMMIRPSGVCLTNLKMCHTLHEEKNPEFPLTQISIASVMTKILRHRTPPSLRHPILKLYSQSFLNILFHSHFR